MEAAAKRAADVLKNRTRVRDVSVSMGEIEDILAYNRSLKAVAGREGLAPGVGPVTLFGGMYDVEANMQDLRDLFRMFVAENIKDGQFTDACQATLGELRTTFGMGAKEADAIVADVSLKVYRMALRKGLADGTLAAAASPARFLQELCDALKFPPPAAEGVNNELYRARLEELMKKERLTDEDDAELQTLRKQLCIPAPTDLAARREVCGEVYKKAVRTAMEAGIDGFSMDLRDKARADPRMQTCLIVRPPGLASRSPARPFRMQLPADDLPSIVCRRCVPQAKKVKDDVKLDDDAAIAVISELAKKARRSRSRSRESWR